MFDLEWTRHRTRSNTPVESGIFVSLPSGFTLRGSSLRARDSSHGARRRDVDHTARGQQQPVRVSSCTRGFAKEVEPSCEHSSLRGERQEAWKSAAEKQHVRAPMGTAHRSCKG